MQTLRDSVYILVAVGSLAMAACQPSESPADRIGKDSQYAPRPIGNQVDKTAEHARKSTDLAP